MADENVRFKFSLDAKDAVKSANELHQKILSIGSSENLSGLVKGFTSVAGPIFVAGAALLTVKKLMDFTKEGEEIMRIEKSFESLTNQYNLSSEALAAGLKKSTKGMLDMTDVMNSANKAITVLGENSAKLPEIMNLARIAGKRFGVETLDAFEAISQAIATGNMKRLKGIGLIVNADEAERKYAKSIGTTIERLSEQGRQTALMNAILEQGDKKFKDTGSSALNFTQQLKVLASTIKDVYDNFTVWVAKNYGPFFADMTSGINKMVKAITGTNTAADEIKNLEDSIDSLQIKINKMSFEKFERADRKGLGAIWGQLISGEGADTILEQNLRAAQARLEQDRAKLRELQGVEDKKDAEAKKDAPDSSGSVSKEKDLLAAAQFHRQLLQLKEARLNAEMAVETNADDFTKQLNEQKILVADQYEARISELKAKAARGEGVTHSEAARMIEQIEAEKIAKIEEMNLSYQDKMLAVYDNQVRAAKTAADGISAAFKQGGMQAQRDLENYGKAGQAAFNIVNKGAVKFFSGLGEGSKDAGELMKEFLLGSLADYAQMQGEVLLAAGIGSFNPIQIVQGGALIALSGLIRSMAGGGGGSSGGGGGGGAAGATPQAQLEKPQLDEDKKKSVTIQVQGNYFETEQSKMRILEMTREATDATDFKYQQIGVR